MNDMLAKVFVLTPATSSRSELFASICKRLGMGGQHQFVETIGALEFEVLNNPDRTLRESDADDFLYYPFIVEVFLQSETASPGRQVEDLLNLLGTLDELNATFVLASDLEEEIGSRSRNDYANWWRQQLRGVSCDAASADEVTKIATDQGAALPRAYEGFLLAAGRRCGPLWVGSNAFFPSVLGLRTAAIELLEEAEAEFVLSSSDVVIGLHQGYEFLYLSGDGPDPAVFRFTEGDVQPSRLSDHFTEFVLSMHAALKLADE